MKEQNNKLWYDKVGVWVGIIAGICTIFAFIYNLNSSAHTNPNTTTSGINENVVGDEAAIIVGNNNTINYKNNDQNSSQNFQTNDSSISKGDDFSVVASYDIDTVQSSVQGIDVLIKAETSFSAEYVTISAISDEANEMFDMHGGTYEWYFKANFYKKGTYTITITAYNSDGESVSDEFTYVY